MKYAELISAIFWLILGLALAIWSTKYQIGSIGNPGPGLYPLGLGLLLIFFSCILLIGWAKKPLISIQVAASFFPEGGRTKVGYSVLILLLASFLFEEMGYMITIFLFMVLLQLGSELRSWKRALLVALLSALGVYVVFVRLLEQPLPTGLLGM